MFKKNCIQLPEAEKCTTWAPLWTKKNITSYENIMAKSVCTFQAFALSGIVPCDWQQPLPFCLRWQLRGDGLRPAFTQGQIAIPWATFQPLTQTASLFCDSSDFSLSSKCTSSFEGEALEPAPVTVEEHGAHTWEPGYVSPFTSSAGPRRRRLLRRARKFTTMVVLNWYFA